MVEHVKDVQLNSILNIQRKHIQKVKCKNANLLSIEGEKQVVDSRVLVVQTMNTVLQIFDHFMGFVPACKIEHEWASLNLYKRIS